MGLFIEETFRSKFPPCRNLVHQFCDVIVQPSIDACQLLHVVDDDDGTHKITRANQMSDDFITQLAEWLINLREAQILETHSPKAPNKQCRYELAYDTLPIYHCSPYYDSLHSEYHPTASAYYHFPPKNSQNPPSSQHLHPTCRHPPYEKRNGPRHYTHHLLLQEMTQHRYPQSPLPPINRSQRYLLRQLPRHM
jgi:hypothetical protein